jgi:4-hydroxyphenylpyruvate dioxygenase
VSSLSTQNPLAILGIEFVEYVTTQPLALGIFLERTGFTPIARHRSREVMLYRQGTMNVVVNASPNAPFNASAAVGNTHIGAVALRVQNAAAAYSYAIANGAWEVPVHAREMELNIPAVRGPGDSEIFWHRPISHCRPRRGVARFLPIVIWIYNDPGWAIFWGG